MKTYLSVDLDYWQEHSTDRSMLRFVDRCLSLKVPTLLVSDHHWLIDHVNQYRADRLINVDYHDDITQRPNRDRDSDFPLDCGNWVSHVKWRRRASYEWRYPWARCWDDGLGLCDAPDLYGESRPTTGWGEVSRQRLLDDINWKSIVAVGIAISPDYSLSPDYCLADRSTTELRHYERTLRKLLRTGPSGHKHFLYLTQWVWSRIRRTVHP